MIRANDHKDVLDCNKFGNLKFVDHIWFKMWTTFLVGEKNKKEARSVIGLIELDINW